MFEFSNPSDLAYSQDSLYFSADNGYDIGLTTERHALTVAGSRSGKGVGLIIPNLLRWPHNVLCIDPKGENAENTYKQRHALNRPVRALDPFQIANIPDELRASFNPLDDIKSNQLTAREDVLVIADGMVKRSDPKHAEWDDGARDILAGLITFVVSEAPPENRTLTDVRNILLQDRDSLYADAQSMTGCEACGGLARAAGVTIMTAIESDKGMEKDFLGAARRHTNWLDSEAIKNVLGASTFKLSDLKNEAASVFLILPPQYMETHAAFMRLFVRCSINVMASGGSGRGEKCLFILDEFFSLGKIDEIGKAAGLMPSYGVHLWPFLQDLGQLQKLYGKEGMETFFGNSDAQIFFGNSDALTLEYISKQIGLLRPEEIYDTPPHLQERSVFWDSKFFENEKDAKERWSREDENVRRNYQHKMGLAGTPRIPPDQVKKLIAKRNGEPVANSMLLFSSSGETYNLAVQPFFDAPAPHSKPKRPKSKILSFKRNKKKLTKSNDSEAVKSRVPLIFMLIVGLGAATVLMPWLINYLTQWLTAYVPVDVAKAFVILSAYIIGLFIFEATFKKVSRVLVRMLGLCFIFGIITQGIYLSDNHITRNSFWFGGYVEFIEKYWR